MQIESFLMLQLISNIVLSLGERNVTGEVISFSTSWCTLESLYFEKKDSSVTAAKICFFECARLHSVFVTYSLVLQKTSENINWSTVNLLMAAGVAEPYLFASA